MTAVRSEVQEMLVRTLGELLVLDPKDIRPDSLLIDDLDADSITFVELSFAIEKDYGVTIPELKADESTFGIPVIQGLHRLEAIPGGVSFFEYVKQEAIRSAFRGSSRVRDVTAALGIPVPAGLDGDAPVATLRVRDAARMGIRLRVRREREADLAERPFAEVLRAGIALPWLEEASRDRLFEGRTLAMVAEVIGGRVPAGLDHETPVSSLRTMDLFRFLTVGSMAGYIESLIALKADAGAGA
jgi:acyl carrier protein